MAILATILEWLPWVIGLVAALIPVGWLIARKTKTEADDKALTWVERVLIVLRGLLPGSGSSSAALTPEAPPQAPPAPQQLPLMYEREPEQPTRLRE